MGVGASSCFQPHCLGLELSGLPLKQFAAAYAIIAKGSYNYVVPLFISEGRNITRKNQQAVIAFTQAKPPLGHGKCN